MVDPTGTRPARPPLWPSCGEPLLARDERGRLRPTDDWWRLLMRRPELAPIDGSCRLERGLHAALLREPTLAVGDDRVARLADPDARESYTVFLRFRDRLLGAGTLEACVLALVRGGVVDVAPLFVDLMVQAIVAAMLRDVGGEGGEGGEGAAVGEVAGRDGPDDRDGGDGGDGGGGDVAFAFEARAAELLFRPQRVALEQGRVLAADLETIDRTRDTAGLGEIGRLLRDAQAPLRRADARVLDASLAGAYLDAAAADRHPMLLDLTHEIATDVGHGVRFRLGNARSGQPALARVLERWVARMLGVRVRIEPVPRIDDARWRWHVGLDAEATALLNDLYEQRAVDDERLARLVGLYTLSFADPAEQRADLGGCPVHLGLAHRADGTLRMKPQNLLLNLPLARVS